MSMFELPEILLVLIQLIIAPGFACFGMYLIGYSRGYEKGRMVKFSGKLVRLASREEIDRKLDSALRRLDRVERNNWSPYVWWSWRR